MANLFALLVGINDYPGSPLQGCVNDVKAFSTYLTDIYGKLPSVNLHKLELTDESPTRPTKKNIIAAFDHFKNAKDKDTCLFYYSGHGSFAPAPPTFAQESTGYLQSFVCSDSRLPGGSDLVDKEMGALIWRVKAEHPDITFVAITDCCHSGTITKAIDNTGIKDRMLGGSGEFLPPSPEQYFGFGLSVNGVNAFEQRQNDAGRISVRQSQHLHLAASRDSQTSKELMIDGKPRGAFTHSLLKTLYNCGGQISYEKLIDTADAYVKSIVPDQNPGLNLNGGIAAATGKTIFLTGEPFRADPSYLVYHDPAYGWCIKAGPLQQVFKGDRVIIDKVATTTVTDNPAPDCSVLIGKPEFGAQGNQYSARVRRKAERLITLSYAPGFPEDTKANLNAAAAADPSSRYTLTPGTEDQGLTPRTEGQGQTPEAPGQWIIRTAETGQVFISLPGTDRPVFEPLPVNDQAGALYFLEQVGIVIAWTNLRQFTNPTQTLTRYHYTIQVKRSTGSPNYDAATFEPIPDWKDPIDLRYQQRGEEWFLPAFELTITNRLDIPLWVTNAWLDFDYGVSTGYFDEMELAPKATMPLSFIAGTLRQSVVKMKIDEKYLRLGYTDITEYLKLFISTQKIETRGLQQSGIRLPAATKKSARSPTDDELADGSVPYNWTTETIGFRTSRPAGGMVIGPDREVTAGGITISKHPELRATAIINSSSLLTRSAAAIPPPNATAHNSYLEPFDLNAGTRSGMQSDVLELFDAQQPASVTPADPLVIDIAGGLTQPSDSILPIGYDPDTGMYYPLGFTNAKGQIVIETLPDPTPNEKAVTYRSFSGSIKIYFQKVLGQRLGLPYDYPRLAVATLNAAGDPVYVADPPTVSSAINEANKILLFVHGIIGDTEGMVRCIKTPVDEKGRTLQVEWDLVLTFDYENLNTPISQTARDLEQKLALVGLKPGHDKQLVIAAHSMGGMVSRWFIENGAGGKIVQKLIMLGTPNNGTPWADVRDLVAALLTFAMNGAALLKPRMFLLSGIGRLVQGVQVTLQEMNPTTGIYDQLNTGKDPGIPYVVVAGNTREIIVDYDKTRTSLGKLFQKLKKRGAYDALDSLLFQEANDIAVADTSIELLKGSETWAEDNKPVVAEVASDHLSYFVTAAALSRIQS